MAVTASTVDLRVMVVLLLLTSPHALWEPLGAGARPVQPILVGIVGHVYRGTYPRSLLAVQCARPCRRSPDREDPGGSHVNAAGRRAIPVRLMAGDALRPTARS